MANAMAENNFLRQPCPLLYAAGHASTFVMRYDAGQSRWDSWCSAAKPDRSMKFKDLALFKVRPMFASLSRSVCTPPFGGNQRTILIKLTRNVMRSYGLTPDELVTALQEQQDLACRNIRIGDFL